MTLSDEELKRRQEVEAPHWAMIAWAGVVVVGVTHTVRTRTIDHILSQSKPFALALVAVLLLALAAILIAERPRPSLGDIARYFVPGVFVLLAMALGVMIVGVVFYALGASAHDLYLWIQQDLTRAQQRSRVWSAAIAALPLAAAVLLFLFRLGFKTIYGLSEAAVGLWIGVQQLEGAALAPALILPILTASVYLMVNGFDNIYQGLTEVPKDPVATSAVEWLRRPWRV